MKKLLKLFGKVVVVTLLVALGFLGSFQVYPVNQRVVHQACYVAGYETVFCQKMENDDVYLYRVIAIKNGEVVSVEHKIPKRKVGDRVL